MEHRALGVMKMVFSLANYQLPGKVDSGRGGKHTKETSRREKFIGTKGKLLHFSPPVG